MVTAVKNISTVSTTNKIKLAVVFLASAGRHWSFLLRLAANSATGALTHGLCTSRLVLKCSKNLHLHRMAYKGQRKKNSCSSWKVLDQSVCIICLCEGDVALCRVAQKQSKSPAPERLRRVKQKQPTLLHSGILANTRWFSFAALRGGRSALLASFYKWGDSRYRKAAASVLVNL